ncbi:hypothetical protein M408DRAFT_235584 [Serendipita vermifera MAFF 305830]|uniref:Uncharacterized protein n=1 Tax=Serendipita vermifera MAFF 305830 TaxID=933852 RepID=A0A0C3BHP3_SERVB|nr:hypothetical protein M408DRAFT_235584 [Serendipita vermifera MAFF 305830]
MGLNHLVSQGIVHDYPPLVDTRGSMTAQVCPPIPLIADGSLLILLGSLSIQSFSDRREKRWCLGGKTIETPIYYCTN